MCCVLRGFCDELITRPEESYRLWCVVVCDLETSWMRRPWPTWDWRAKNKHYYYYYYYYYYYHHQHFSIFSLIVVIYSVIPWCDFFTSVLYFRSLHVSGVFSLCFCAASVIGLAAVAPAHKYREFNRLIIVTASMALYRPYSHYISSPYHRSSLVKCIVY